MGFLQYIDILTHGVSSTFMSNLSIFQQQNFFLRIKNVENNCISFKQVRTHVSSSFPPWMMKMKSTSGDVWPSIYKSQWPN
jgi:hypothetical protein